MVKVITLEKGDDGVYAPAKDAKIEEEKPEIDYAQFEKTVEIPRKTRKRAKDNKKVHEFIVEHGTNAADFLTGVEKTVKAILMFKRLMK